MRATRLVSALMLLQARGRLTAQQLADELEVSVRTVYRDMEALGAAGIPVYGEVGPDGGYQLVAGYRTRLTGLTSDEAAAHFLAGLPGPAAELGLGAVVAAADRKVQAALPAAFQDAARQIRERFHLDAPAWYHEPDQSPFLAEVARAVWTQRLIRVGYRRWRAPTDVTRTLAPYGIVLKAGRWYLVAAGSGVPRTYRVGSILTLDVLPETFERPSGFDLAAHWTASTADFAERLVRGTAEIRLSPAGLSRVGLLGAAAVRAFDGVSPDEDGWVTATVPIETDAHAESVFLQLGADLEVVTPTSLRDRMRDTARAMALVYGC